MSNRFLQYKHIFFDLDGTLCDTEKDLRNGWLKVMSDLALDVPEFDKLFRIGPQAPDMARMLFPSLDEAEVKKAVELFVATYDHSGHTLTRPYPWIEGFLHYLRENGVKCYILTNKRKYPTKYLVNKFGWNDLFDGVFTPDMHEGKRYAKSELLGILLKELDIVPESALIIGDTTVDINAGKSNNISAAGVLWGYGFEEELTGSGCDMLLSAKDFEQWL